MKRWFQTVVSAGTAGDADLLVALQAVDAYADEYSEAKKDLRVDGERIENIAAKIPGMTDHRWAQVMDLNSIVDYLEHRERRALFDEMQRMMDHYQRQLTYQQYKDYADTSDPVQTIRLVRQQVGDVFNLFQGIHKGIDALNYQVSNITKLRTAGCEDATIVLSRPM